MSKLGELSERALDLVEQAGDKLKLGGDAAGKLLQTGAAFGVVRTGAKVATGFVRRNPVVAVAAGVGIGLLAFAAYRRRKRAQMLGSTEGPHRRIDPRRVEGRGQDDKRKSRIIDAEMETPSAEN